mmetsp:Transcript_28161/g.49119  ORF Transcript_28161/g.49119 Transcript_28161/m.49119 type:complete len:450 (+) Transcript_28161:83-1432(+)
MRALMTSFGSKSGGEPAADTDSSPVENQQRNLLADPDSMGGAEDCEPISEMLPQEASSFSSMVSYCAACGCALGKRRLKPKHHCRLCMRVVCDSCSPNRMQLEEQKGAQRVCTDCGANAVQAPDMKARLEQVACHIATVSGPRRPSFTFADSVLAGDNLPTATSVQSVHMIRTLGDAVTLCEEAANSLMDAFHSHQATKLRVEEVEAEVLDERQARQRLEAVADRVGQTEAELEEERQTRKRFEAQARQAKLDIDALSARLHNLSGGHGARGAPPSSLEEAVAQCEAAYAKVEASLLEERQVRRELAAEKRAAEASRDVLEVSREKGIAVLQAELQRARAEIAQERKLRGAAEAASLRSSISRTTTSPHSSLLLQGSSSSNMLLHGSSSSEADAVGERIILYQGPPPKSPKSAPRRMEPYPEVSPSQSSCRTRACRQRGEDSRGGCSLA